jgi:hypothetical protein
VQYLDQKYYHRRPGAKSKKDELSNLRAQEGKLKDI